MTMNMTDEEAKKEHEDIQAEIAREKGIKPDAEEEKDEPDDKEPAAEKEEQEKDQEEEDEDKDEPADDDEDEDAEPEKKPEVRERTSRHIPLPKYQELKRTSKEALDAKDAKIAELQEELTKSATTKAVAEDVKAHAEKYGMTEEAVYDLLKIAHKANPVDPAIAETVKKAAVIAKKQEAEDSFKAELAELVKDFPEASEQADKIRQSAFKEGNLSKSLHTIYLREVKPTISVKKKTGEASRGAPGRDTKSGELDFAKIAADLKANKPGVLDGYSGEDQDKIFDWMNKNGSRYQR